MQFFIGQLIFFLLTPVSHICASLFFAKPRFGKVTTVVIWVLYAVALLILPTNLPTFNFFFALAVHFILFFTTTVGHAQEKGFLFFSYANIYICFSIIFNIVNTRMQSEGMKSILAITLMVLMQVLLYRVLLPVFRKVTPYIRIGWGKFYAVVLGFFALIVVQAVLPKMSSMMLPTTTPMTDKEIAVFLLTTLIFCITYAAMFASMKNMMELAQAKQKQIHAELLLMQVQSQAKEAELLRQTRHDMRHHYQMLLSYAESGDLSKLSDYLKRHTEYIETITTGRFCENETVNNILKVYHQKATEKNIAVDIRAAAKPNITASAPELVSIVANALENALHGAAQSGSRSPFIRVSIKHQSGRFVVSCDNSCTKALDFEEMPEYLKGIGIQSITATANKYDGSCRFSAKDGVFHCMVIMDE